MIKIYLSDDSELGELYCIERGCRTDVLVEIDGKYYFPIINTIERLTQDVYDAFATNEVFDTDPCQIIVKEVRTDHIINAVLKLEERGFFEYFCPMSLNKYKNSFNKLTDINNWKQVY